MNPDKGYIAYIVNPKSGAGGGRRMVDRFRDYLNSKGFEVRMSFTDSLEHACEIATKAAVDYQCAMVVAAGGDGTIREAAHGMEGSDKLLMIIPCGTENLLANELGFDKRAETMIKAFEAGCLHDMDLGSANGRCFTSIAGIGFDGEIVKRVSDRRQGHINYLHYVWPIFQTFWRHKFPRLRVVIDGTEIFDGRGMAFVGNISRYALGLGILYNADFGDGLLDVCIYKCRSRLHLIKHSLMTIFKFHTDSRDVIYRRGKNIEISSTSPQVRTEIDGDPGPDLPMKIEVIPRAVKVIIPPKARPAGMRKRFLRMLVWDSGNG